VLASEKAKIGGKSVKTKIDSGISGEIAVLVLVIRIPYHVFVFFEAVQYFTKTIENEGNIACPTRPTRIRSLAVAPFFESVSSG